MRNLVNIRSLLLSISTLFPLSSQAQIKDSVAIPKLPSYPLIRPLVLQYERINNADYKLRDRNGDLLGEGQAQATRFRAFASTPMYQHKKMTFSANILYTYEDVSNYTREDPSSPLVKNTMQVNDVDLTLSGMYQGVLWKKPVIHTANIRLSSPNLVHVKKVSAIGSSSVIFVKGAQTRYSLGLLFILDPAIALPVIPMFTYWHQFNNPLWEADIIFPQKIIFRKSGFLNGWLSVGTELYGNAFFASESTQLAGNYEYRYTDLFSGVGYERMLGKLILGVRTGFRSTIQGRMLKVYNRNSDYLFDTKNKTVPYINLHISWAMPYLFKPKNHSEK